MKALAAGTAKFISSYAARACWRSTTRSSRPERYLSFFGTHNNRRGSDI